MVGPWLYLLELEKNIKTRIQFLKALKKPAIPRVNSSAGSRTHISCEHEGIPYLVRAAVHHAPPPNEIPVGGSTETRYNDCRIGGSTHTPVSRLNLPHEML
jgi:hypothetical protein